MKKYAIGLAILVMMVANLFIWQSVEAASAGPNYTSTQVNTSLNPGDDVAWANLANMGANDGSFATCNIDFSLFDFSQRADTTGYGFSIPTGATINGVVVEVSRKTSDAASQSRDVGGGEVLLSAGGTIGTGKNLVSDYTTSLVTATYGSSTDLWGATLTPTIINSSTFGFGYIFFVNNGSATVSVDFIRITVYYTASNTTRAQVVQRSGTTIIRSGTVIIP